ncbi:MAG: methyltransferase domain-containing protein [Acidobacteria bacterium]|nr:methyltransferase domain-containing protein [Acidobacteriota bacterium]MBV9476125.1 methyltransferase domain-containing protein [Acidobacteriota bacterium]
MTSHYRDDLAYIHHVGFTGFAEAASLGILERLWRNGIREGLVVDTGCGSGVLARELTHAGFDVFGIDASEAMLAIARETAPRARFAQGSFASAELPDANAIVAVGEVLNYGTFDDVRAFVARASTALRANGLLLFDVAERDSYPAHDEHRVDGKDWSVIVVRESDGRTLTRRVLSFRELDGRVARDDETHTLELYDRAELLALLRGAGFRVRVARGYGAGARVPKGHAVYIAQKLLRPRA